jgi:hypothetical protein
MPDARLPRLKRLWLQIAQVTEVSANEKMNLNLALVGRNSDFLFAAKMSIESVYTTTRIKNSLLAGTKRMALRANV